MHRTHFSQADTRGTGAVHAIREAVHRRPAAGLRAGTDEGGQQEQWLLQADGGQADLPDEEEKQPEKQVISAHGRPRREASGGREVRAVVLRFQRGKELPVHGEGRVHALDLPGNAQRSFARKGLSGKAGQERAVPDPHDSDRQRRRVHQCAARDQIHTENTVQGDSD